MTEGSPYLSVRRAVRPAIFAHRLLAGEQERAGKLAADCEDLLLHTRELLKAAGQARLLEPGQAGAERPDPDDGGRQALLLEAYADAGLLWAKVVGCCLALAGTLIDRGEWDEARQLAGFLADAGEAGAAAGLRADLGKAIWATHAGQLSSITSTMPPEGIRKAIKALRAILLEVPEEFPDRNRQVNRLLPPLAASILAIMRAQQDELPFNSRVQHIASGGVAKYPDIVTMSLDELSAEFEGSCSW